MPQLDIDLFDDFLFFAFISLLFGVGDDESEEAVIDMAAETHLVTHYYTESKKLRGERIVLENLQNNILGSL